MEDTKVCALCHRSFEPKRSDQKFCSLKCKNTLNNKKIKALYRQRKDEDIIAHETNTTLMTNRNLLKANCNKKVSMESLVNIGFTLNIVSGFEQKPDELPCLFCYDYGYQFIDAKSVKIFKR
jgi:predicted nucleic acid-binding Zn ribbon protein